MHMHATAEQRLSEQAWKGDLVQQALTIERLIAQLDYNFLRTEILNHVQEVVSSTFKVFILFYKHLQSI